MINYNYHNIENKTRIEALENENKKLKEQVDKIDKEARKNNLVIYGIDTDRDNSTAKVLQVINEAADMDFPEHKMSDIYHFGRKRSVQFLKNCEQDYNKEEYDTIRRGNIMSLEQYFKPIDLKILH
ncbi:hypothetical protein HHI36_008945, partial [Cryptolaemus montrouzieri]